MSIPMLWFPLVFAETSATLSVQTTPNELIVVVYLLRIANGIVLVTLLIVGMLTWAGSRRSG